MKKTRVISAIFLAVFLCLSVSAVYAQNDQYETHAQIHSVSLNGQGDYLKIEPGGLIEVEVFYEFRYPYPLPKDISEIVVGFEDTAGICLIDGILDKIPGLTGVFDYSTIFGMNAPTEPGIYHIMRVRTEGYTCQGARELYRDYPSTRKIIGTIEVIGSESDERDQGAIEVTHVSLNFVGLKDWFDVEPGELLEAIVCYDYLYPWHLQKHEYRVVVGYEDTALFCIDEEIRREYPGNTGDGSDCTIFTMKAPMEPGIYSIYKTYTKGLTRSEAKEHYENNPDAREIIDHFEVKADVPEPEPEPEPDEDDEWEHLVTIRTADYVYFNPVPYTTSVYQRGAVLRVNITAYGYYALNDGSVIFSVDEDVYVHYNTESAYGDFSEVGMIKIKPDPMDKWSEKSAMLLIGLVPYVGWGADVLNYVDETMVQPYGVYKYQEYDGVELEHDLIPKDFFESRYAENDRDTVNVVWVPPAKLKSARKIVVYSPRLLLDLEESRTVILRIDCYLHGKKIRHDIALSVTIPSEWNAEIDFSKSKEIREI